MSWEDLTVRYGFAAILSILMGVEHQWRNARFNWFINLLACLAATALIIFILPANTDDASRNFYFNGIVLSIGALTGAIMFFEGIKARGFNDAATLWAGLAAGIFTGAGYFGFAAFFTMAIILTPYFRRNNL